MKEVLLLLQVILLMVFMEMISETLVKKTIFQTLRGLMILKKLILKVQMLQERARKSELYSNSGQDSTKKKISPGQKGFPQPDAKSAGAQTATRCTPRCAR